MPLPAICIQETYTYNKRLQPLNIQAKGKVNDQWVTRLDLTYNFVETVAHSETCYDENGDPYTCYTYTYLNDGPVKSVTNNLVTGRSQTYTYDEMNRLKTAQAAATSGANCWSESYTYDRYANLSQIGAVSGGCAGEYLNLGIAPYTNKVTNTGFTYDATGNVTNDGLYGYTWNAEGRMASGAEVSYTYDGDVRRVKKSNGKLYWYGLKGEVLAESDLSGNVTSEYIYFNGQRIARRDPGTGNGRRVGT